jgi:hypothetical protein
MRRAHEQGGRRGRLGLTSLLVAAGTVAAVLALALPAGASADFSLTIKFGGTGSGTVECRINEGATGACASSYAEGTEVELLPTSAAGSSFTEFTGACTGEICDLILTENQSVTVVFTSEPAEYLLEINAGGSGEGEWECTVGGVKEFCEEEYPEGTHVTITARSYEGSKAAVFAGDCSGSTCSLVMDKDHAVTVIFNLKEFILTVKKNGGSTSGKVICELEEGPEPCKEKYAWATSVTVIAIPEPGYEFSKWEGCDKEPTPGSCEVEIEEAQTVTVTFTKEVVPAYFTLKVTKAGSGAGTVTSFPAGINCGATCEGKFEEGKEVTLVATPDGGSTFAGWSGSGCSGTSACKVTMNSAKEITATFAPKPTTSYSLTVQREGTGSGSVTSDPPGIECGADCTEDYPEGTSVTLTATAADGSVFKRWTGMEGECALERVCRTKMGDSKVVQAVFASAESGIPPEAAGTVRVVKRIALVRNGAALLVLRCSGGPCKGGLQLTARLKAGRKSLVIGKRSFTLASGGRRTVRIKLSAPARKAVAERGKLTVEVTGNAVLRSTVKLKNAKQGH